MHLLLDPIYASLVFNLPFSPPTRHPFLLPAVSARMFVPPLDEIKTKKCAQSLI